MLMAALDLDPAEALVRLRAYAYSHDITASELAWAIVERTVNLEGDDWRSLGGQTGDNDGR